MTVLAILAVSLGIDLVVDLNRRATLFHASVEGSAIIAAAVGVVPGARRLRTALHEAQDLREQARTLASTLHMTRREAERWRREASAFVSGLGVAIEQHFECWGLRRHDLAAFFLEDLLAPRSAGAANASSNASARRT